MMEKITNFIDGAMVEPASGKFMDNVDPATGSVYSLVAESGPEDVDRAVAAGRKAFPGWRAMKPEDRAACLNRMADLIDRDLESFARAESIDNGKPVSLARTVDIPRAAANFRAFAGIAPEFCARRSFESAEPPARGYVLHQPVGVVASISPWNLPLLLFTWKIAPALAAGNCVVAKPSEITPMTAFMLSALANEAGFPPGVLNVIHGTGQGAGGPLVEHRNVLRLSFTGSTATGMAINAICAKTMKKPPALEMGGKNPVIVFDDADFDAAVEKVKAAAFTNQGQICLCGSRIYVQEGIYAKFLDALKEKTEAISIGDPLDPATQHGAMVSRAHMDKVLGYIGIAKQEGGKIIAGGNRAAIGGRCENGYFIEPTLIEGLPNGCRTNQEEIFGPVATLIPFRTEEEAIALANDSEYGLAASIWSADLDRAMRVADALETGMPWINCWNLRVLNTPFGGWKNSGNGHREGAPDALEFFTEKKAVVMPGNGPGKG